MSSAIEEQNLPQRIILGYHGKKIVISIIGCGKCCSEFSTRNGMWLTSWAMTIKSASVQHETVLNDRIYPSSWNRVTPSPWLFLGNNHEPHLMQDSGQNISPFSLPGRIDARGRFWRKNLRRWRKKTRGRRHQNLANNDHQHIFIFSLSA